MPLITFTPLESMPEAATIKVPLMVEPQVSPSENEALLAAVHAAVKGDFEPVLKIPASYMARELDTTSNLDAATNRASLAWLRSRTRDAYMELYRELSGAPSMAEALKSVDLGALPKTLEEALDTPHALLKAINPPWHVSLWDFITDKAHRLMWGFYGAVLLLCLQLAFGAHGGG